MPGRNLSLLAWRDAAAMGVRVKLEAVLFDLDGVLIDSADVWFHVLNAAAAEWGYPAIPAAKFRACFGQGIDADRETFFPSHTNELLDAYFNAHFLEHAAHLCVDASVPEVFAALHERALATAVVTNSTAALARALVARARATPALIVCAGATLRPKPAPDIVLEACRVLGVAPAHALVVGDSAYDREAARAAGVPFAGLRTAGDFRCERLADVLALID